MRQIAQETKTLPILLLLGLTLVPSSQRVDAAPLFKLEISGMVAFAAEGDALHVLLVNMPDTRDHVTHFPGLEIKCDQLKSDSLFADKATAVKACNFLPPSFQPGFRAMSLQGGYTVAVKPDGKPLLGRVTRDASFTGAAGARGLVVPMSGITLDKEFRTLAKRALDPAAKPPSSIVTLKLNDGTIKSQALSSVEWSFGTSPFAGLQPHGKSAAFSTWEVGYKDFVDLELSLMSDPKKVERTIRIEHSASLEAALTNEPDLAEYCAHAPMDTRSPATHFTGFWGISKGGANASTELLRLLPLPYPDDAHAQGCSWNEFHMLFHAGAGRRVNCMQVFFDEIEP
jgi:hypothetical protein